VASALQGWVARKLLIGVGGLFCVPTDLSPRASMAWPLWALWKARRVATKEILSCINSGQRPN